MTKPKDMTAVELTTDPTFKALVRRMAAVQPAEGTRIDDDTWVWIQAFVDFDYEYSYLMDVRRSVEGGGTMSQYLAIFEGYDQHGQSVYRANWWRKPVLFPEVPDLYDALAWWAGWLSETRRGEHGQAS